MDYKFYLVEDNRLFCAVNNQTFELINNEWSNSSNNEIMGRILGYDPNESSDLPYAIGNMETMSTIKELTQEQVIEEYGVTVIDKLKNKRDNMNMSMYIETKKRNIENVSLQEIIELVKNNKGLEEIWVSKDSKKYPCLAIQLNNDLACVSYFPKDEKEINWTSLGNYDKETIFLSGGEEWLAPANAIITIEQTIECLTEFYKNRKDKPKSIKWQKLI